jgi:cytochrome b6-f complex iron-sulfur subunit
MHPEFRQQLGDLLSSGVQPRGFTRRQALGGGLAAAAGLVVGVGVERLVASVDLERAPGAYVVPSPGQWVDVAAVGDLPEGQATHVSAGAVSGYLFRAGSNVHAVSSTCSHYPCALSWDTSQRNILCPCHMQRFSTDGQPIAAGYDLPPLKRLQVRVLDGRVQVLGTA